MEHSATIGKLAEALAKAQGEIKNATKSSENPFFKSHYADLASVRNACQAALSANGLAVIQTTEGVEAGILLETTLAHSSGEWLRGRLKLTPTKSDPQGIGSAITYGRRYALAAIVGVATEDDDGNAASEPQNKASKPVEKPAPKVEPKHEAAPGCITEAQANAIYSTAKKQGYTAPEVTALLVGKFPHLKDGKGKVSVLHLKETELDEAVAVVSQPRKAA